MATKNQTKITAEPGKHEVIITREFDAPRELVFKAFTDPKLVTQWWGPRYLKTTLKTFEPKNGGNWNFIQTAPDGRSFHFHGVFHEVLAPERIIQTFEFDDHPEKGHVAMETAKFESLPGDRTRVTRQYVFQTVADRDSMIQSGMEKGVYEGNERLDEIFEKQLVK